jgi:hypothetical protein
MRRFLSVFQITFQVLPRFGFFLVLTPIRELGRFYLPSRFVQ